MATKILYVITKANWGGAQRYVFDIAGAAQDAGHDVAVIVGGNGPLVTRLIAKNIRVIPLANLVQKRAFLSDLLSFAPLFTLVRILHRERPAIVHLNSAKAGGLGALAARVTGTPKIIFTAHGWEFKGERSSISKIGIRVFSWITMLLAHRVIAVSEAVRDAVVTWPYLRGKIVVIKNGVESFPLLDREHARAALAASCPTTSKAFSTSPAFVICSVAELTPIKGLAYGIAALAALQKDIRRRVYWIIIGEGKLRRTLMTDIRSKNLENQILLTGFLPEARQYLTAFDAFLFPSLYEAMPYALLEAGRAALPVIASQAGGIPEIIESNVNGLLVPVTDSAVISRSIERLVATPELRKRLGSALQKTITEHFSRKTMLGDTLRVYGH